MINESAKVYQTILDAMEKKNLEYQRNDEELKVSSLVSGELLFLPVQIRLSVDEDRKLIRLIAPLGFHFPEKRRVDGALATGFISSTLAYGAFEYDISDGEVNFRMANPYENCDIHVNTIIDMVMYTLATLHTYVEPLFMISKGMMDVEDFLNKERR